MHATVIISGISGRRCEEAVGGRKEEGETHEEGGGVEQSIAAGVEVQPVHHAPLLNIDDV